MNMKHLTLTFCALVTALALTACGSAPQSTASTASGADSAAVSASVSAPSASQSEAAADDYHNYTFEFTVPEGFAEADASAIGADELYQAEDGSNINVVITADDGSLASDVTQDMLVPVLEQAFTEQLGEDITLENVSFSNDDIAGCPAYRLSYTLNVSGLSMTQTVLGLNGDNIYTITFTDMTGSWADTFEQTIAGISAVPA